MIVLFGSHAWGEPGPDSDFDILVIVQESNEEFYKRPVTGYRALRGIKESIEIIVMTLKEYREASVPPASLFNKIMRQGVKLYEAA